MTAATAAIPRARPEASPLLKAAIVIVVGVAATTLGQPALLARLPLQNLLKNELHVARAANAAFFFWCIFPWYFKPFAGIITDAFPLLGSRRKSYMLISATLAVGAWVGLFLTPHRYGDLLWAVIAINVCMVVTSTVVGAYMVEIAQATAGTGRLTALREFVQQICRMINGPLSGYLASIAFGWTAGVSGAVVFLIIPVAFLFLQERRSRIASREILAAAGVQMRRIATARTMWAAAGLMALFYIAPGLTTAVFYKQQNELHMTTQGQGFLQLLYGMAGVAAATTYAFACRRVALRTLLCVCMLSATCSNLAYLFYTSVGNAHVIVVLDGWGYTLAELALMDLAIRATPAGSEGLGFSLMMSVRNLALFGTDWLGSAMLDRFHLPFSALVLSNSATTAITVPLVFLLPRVLTRRKDAELYDDAPAARGAVQD